MKKFILLFLVLIILMVPVLSFADIDILSIIPTNIKDYWIITKNPETLDYYLYASDYKFYGEDVNGWCYYTSWDGTPALTTGKNVYILDDENWSYQGCNGGKIDTSQELITSNHDIYISNTGNVFFSPIPPVSSLVMASREMTSQELLMVILTGLPLVLGCLILVIAFRKAWVFLQLQLRH